MNATIYCKTFTELSIAVSLICFIFSDYEYFIGSNSIFKSFTFKPYHKHKMSNIGVCRRKSNVILERHSVKKRNIS